MKISESKKVLLHLQKELDLTKPIDKQLTQLFAISLFSKAIIPTKSLQGRVSNWIGRGENQKRRADNIKLVIAKAFKTFQDSPQEFQALSLHFRVKLYDDLHKEKLIDLPASIISPNILISELESLKKSSEKAHEDDLDYIQKNSELRMSDISFFEQIIQKHPKDEDKYQAKINILANVISPHPEIRSFLSYFQNYLCSQPAYAKRDLISHFNMLSLMLRDRSSIEEEFKRSTNPLKCILDIANQLEKEISSLETGSKKLFGGSYGKHLSPLEGLIPILKKLPEAAWKDIPTPVANLIKSNKLTNLSTIAKEEVSKSFAPLKAQIKEFSELLYISRLAFLFEDKSRDLSPNTKKILPRKIAETLEYWMRNSVLIGIAELIPDGELREIMLWVSEKGILVKDANEREKFITQIETDIVNKVLSPLDKMSSKNGSVTTILDNIQCLLTPEYQNSLKLTPFISSGELWVEFERKSSDNFTLNIYATGNLLNNPGFIASNQNIRWPLCIKNVPKEKINSAFLQKLAFYHLKPKKDGEHRILINTLFSELFSEILNDPKIKIDDASSFNVRKPHMNEVEVAESYLIDPTVPLEAVNFELRWSTLLAFCHSFINKDIDKISFDKLSTCDLVEKTVEIVEKEALELADLLGRKVRMVKIDATLKEIKAAINESRLRLSPKTKSTPEEEVIKLISGGLMRSGISLDTLEENRGLLCWVLGEEFGDFIDALTYDKTKNNQSLIPLNISKKHPPSLIRKIIFSTLFQCAVYIIKIAILINTSRTKLLEYEVLVWQKLIKKLWKELPAPIKKQIEKFLDIIGSYIPEPIKNTYCRVKGVLDYIDKLYDQLIASIWHTLLEISIELLLKILIPSKNLKQLKGITHNWRENIVNVTRTLLDSERVDLKLPPYITHTNEPLNFDSPIEPDLIALNPHRVRPGLTALRKFCHSSQMNCWTKPFSKVIERIDFVPFKLTFVFDPSLNAMKAVDEDKQEIYPDYFLASKQKDQMLQGFSSYLILKNNQGRKKVLIPSDQWISALTWNGAKRIGPYATFFHQWLNRITQQSSSYFEYDLNNNGVLTSDRPDNLAYVLAMYLLQGKIEQAEAVCDQFEKIASEGPLPSKLPQQLLPMALIPATMTHTSMIRRRMFAMIEENYQKYTTSPNIDPKSHPETAIEDLAWALCISEDLRISQSNQDPRKNLSDKQEWFLYKGMIRRYQNLLEENPERAELKAPAEQLTEHQLIKMFGFTPEMCEHFASLKSKFTEDLDFEPTSDESCKLSLDTDQEIVREKEEYNKAFDSLRTIAFDLSDITAANVESEASTQLTEPDTESLWKLYLNLVSFKDQIKGEVENEEESLLAIINNKSDVEPLNIKDLLKYYEKNELNQLRTLTTFPEKQFGSLAFAIAKHQIKAKKLPQLENAIHSVKSLSCMHFQNPNYQTTLFSLSQSLSCF